MQDGVAILVERVTPEEITVRIQWGVLLPECRLQILTGTSSLSNVVTVFHTDMDSKAVRSTVGR